MRWTLVLAFLLLGGAAPGQTKKASETSATVFGSALVEAPKTSSEPPLETLLQKALRQNPDIRLAETRVREAEAMLNKVRMETLQKIVSVHQQIKMAQIAVDDADLRYKRMEMLERSRAISTEEITGARIARQRARAELEMARALLPALLGEQPRELGPLPSSASGKATAEAELARRLYLDLLGRLPTVEETREALALDVTHLTDLLLRRSEDLGRNRKLREFLDTPVKLEVDQLKPGELLEFLRTRTKDVNILVRFPVRELGEEPYSLKLSSAVPVGALLQWFEDNFTVTFILRDYGIVVVERDRVPPGATPVLQIWKSMSRAESRKVN